MLSTENEYLFRSLAMAAVFAFCAIIFSYLVKLMVKDSLAMTFFILFFLYLFRYAIQAKFRHLIGKDTPDGKLATYFL